MTKPGETRIGRRRRRGPALLAAAALGLAPIPAMAAAAAIAGSGGVEPLATALARERARPAAPRIERGSFLVRPRIRSAALSPDGRQVAYLEGDPDAAEVSLRLVAAGGGASRLLASRTAAREPLWSQDGHWIFLAESDRLSRVDVDAGEGGGASRMLVALGGGERRELLAVDPTRPASLLLRETVRAASPSPSGPVEYRLVRLDTEGGRELLYSGEVPLAGVALAPSGALAFAKWRDGDGFAIARVAAGGGWQKLLHCSGDETCDLLTTTPDGRTAWLLGRQNGDLTGLLQLGQEGEVRALHRDPAGVADVANAADVVLDPRDGQPVLVAHRSVAPTLHGLTDGARRALVELRKRFLGRELRITIGHGTVRRWLVEERADTLQGRRFHLYEPQTDRLTPILPDSAFATENLPESAMARKIPFSYRASDGRRLWGFLSVPPGRDLAQAPLVARVHGGPFSRTEPGFDATTQFLAQRGCVVFEPNFRGSTGHGREYLLAAHGDFGNGRVQKDVEDGVRFLLALGVGDPQRVGILGASFGGYSALLGLTFSPELFRVGIAAVPPTDFGWTIRYMAERDRGDDPDSLPLARGLRFLELDPADADLAERLRRDSPAANAGRMNRPLLLFAGGEDDRIALRSVLDYAARLRTLGKPVALYVAADEGHQLESTLQREVFFALVEELLARHLGTAAPTPRGAHLQAEVARNLRLAPLP